MDLESGDNSPDINYPNMGDVNPDLNQTKTREASLDFSQQGSNNESVVVLSFRALQLQRIA